MTQVDREGESGREGRSAAAGSEIRAVVFDFDGVILESVEVKTDAFATLFSSRPDHVPAIVELHRANAGMSRYEKFDRIYRDIFAEPLTDGERERLAREFARLVFEKILVCDFVPGAPECLGRLARGHRLFVASATPEEEVREIAKRRELDGFFVSVYGGPAAKTEILTRILRDEGLAPGQVVFVGDARADYEAARTVGIRFVGRVPAGEPAPFPANSVAPTIRDLRDLDRVLKQMRGLM